ncbi:hypothetical protein ACLOJK_011413 [Asimina triloba]
MTNKGDLVVDGVGVWNGWTQFSMALELLANENHGGDPEAICWSYAPTLAKWQSRAFLLHKERKMRSHAIRARTRIKRRETVARPRRNSNGPYRNLLPIKGHFANLSLQKKKAKKAGTGRLRQRTLEREEKKAGSWFRSFSSLAESDSSEAAQLRSCVLDEYSLPGGGDVDDDEKRPISALTGLEISWNLLVKALICAQEERGKVFKFARFGVLHVIWWFVSGSELKQKRERLTEARSEWTGGVLTFHLILEYCSFRARRLLARSKRRGISGDRYVFIVCYLCCAGGGLVGGTSGWGEGRLEFGGVSRVSGCRAAEAAEIVRRGKLLS